jgi:hypothetical protein
MMKMMVIEEQYGIVVERSEHEESPSGRTGMILFIIPEARLFLPTYLPT